MLDLISQWIADYLVWIGSVSAVVFILSLALMPYLVSFIDEDYFIGLEERKLKIKNTKHLLTVIVKSVLGSVLIISGIIMLVTPGQGLITILLGLFLIEFPGKNKCELRLIHHNPTFKTLNWLRNKAGKPPFKR